MKIKSKIILLCSIILILAVLLLVLCGCDNTNKEELTFNMAYTDNTKYNDSIIIERYTNILVLPKNTSFFKDDELFKSAYYFYDVDTKESVPIENISIDTSNLNINEVGTYKIRVTGKYDNKVGNTEIDVNVVESYSGNCTIKTSNWIFEISDNIKYQDISDTYRILNVPIKMTPTDNAFYSSSTKTTNYSDLLHGFITLRVDNGTFISTYVADDEDDRTIGENDNALAQMYIRNKTKDLTTYLKFRVVPIIETEAYIDFYDEQTKEHHFYYINN